MCSICSYQSVFLFWCNSKCTLDNFPQKVSAKSLDYQLEYEFKGEVSKWSKQAIQVHWWWSSYLVIPCEERGRTTRQLECTQMAKGSGVKEWCFSGLQTWRAISPSLPLKAVNWRDSQKVMGPAKAASQKKQPLQINRRLKTKTTQVHLSWC